MWKYTSVINHTGARQRLYLKISNELRWWLFSNTGNPSSNSSDVKKFPSSVRFSSFILRGIYKSVDGCSKNTFLSCNFFTAQQIQSLQIDIGKKIAISETPTYVIANGCSYSSKIFCKQKRQMMKQSSRIIIYYKRKQQNLFYSWKESKSIQTWVTSAEATHIITKTPIKPSPALYFQLVIQNWSSNQEQDNPQKISLLKEVNHLILRLNKSKYIHIDQYRCRSYNFSEKKMHSGLFILFFTREKSENDVVVVKLWRIQLHSRRIVCEKNLRQVSKAMFIYEFLSWGALSTLQGFTIGFTDGRRVTPPLARRLCSQWRNDFIVFVKLN